MHVEIDQTWWTAPVAAASIAPIEVESGGSLDWFGLRARFLASHAVRAAMDAIDPARVIVDIAALSPLDECFTAGSFDRRSAQMLNTYSHPLSRVNPTDLSDGKARWSKVVSATGVQPPGGRGYT